MYQNEKQLDTNSIIIYFIFYIFNIKTILIIKIIICFIKKIPLIEKTYL